jgi:hypothetical protein
MAIACHLLAKLSYEIDLLAADPRNGYAAINALRDAYHLREWIRHGRLENDPALQAEIMGASGSESKWNEHVNQCFIDFPLIHELCNGSKHFERKASDKVQATHHAGYGSPLFAYNSGPLGYGVEGIFVQVEAGVVSVMHLLESARDFWVHRERVFNPDRKESRGRCPARRKPAYLTAGTGAAARPKSCMSRIPDRKNGTACSRRVR